MAEIAISKGDLKQYGDDANNIIVSGLYAYNGLEKEIENMPAPAPKEPVEAESEAPERAELSSDEESF